MNKITLWKKYSNGDVRSLEINETKDGVMHMLANGFFLTEKEAKAGKVDAPAKRQAKPKRVASQEE